MRTFVSLSLLGALSAVSFAASHNDAPLINMDPAANITDVYSFVGVNARGTKVLNIAVTLNPLEDPGNGVNYYKFDDDLLYSIHIAKPQNRNGQPFFTGESAITYNFRFKTDYKNLDTILSYGLGTEAGAIRNTGDARQNMTQSFQVKRIVGNQKFNLTEGLNPLASPVNVGPRTTPNYYRDGQIVRGATSEDMLDSYTRETILTLRNGTRIWAGQREDGFYADVPAIFDFLGVRNPGKDGFSGYNVHAIVMQIPVSDLVGKGEIPVVGVYATTSRKKVSVRGFLDPRSPWIQVSRMGNPLFNETLIALRDKDFYNSSQPTVDRERFRRYAENCELAFLLNAVFGTNFVVNDRTDLVGIFIPDVLKVDLSTEDVPLACDQKFNRLSFIGGDTVLSRFTGRQVPSGWPNGRRFGDDVVDIALTAVASGPSFETITVLSDNSNANDALYDRVFPYAGTPHGGTTTSLR